MRLHHLGMAVESIESGTRQVRKMWGRHIAHESDEVFDPLQDAYLRLFELDDGSRIELVAGKPVRDFLRRGVAMHHVCYEVASVDAAVDEWQRGGALLVSPPKPAVLFDGRMVAFVYTALGLVEFLSDA